MVAVVVIPARYRSSRFPGKPLVPLNGKPLIWHVWEKAKKARLARDVLIATDDRRIYRECLDFGARAVMTSDAHPSGTDRVAEAAKGFEEADVIVNLQGDEPLIRPEMIDAVIEALYDGRADMGTLVKRIESREEFEDPNVVKAVLDEEGFALYFSRSPIPYNRDGGGLPAAWKHIGIYSYRKEALARLTALRPTGLEETEKLEQLRALGHGMKIKARQTRFETIGVDTPEDLIKVGKWLNSYS